MKNSIRLIALAAGLCSFGTLGGHFSSNTVPIAKAPGANPYFLSSTDYIYVDKNKKKWIAPTNTITDGASIPQLCYSVVGQPFDPQFLGAALIHDAYTAKANQHGPSYHQGTWQDVNLMFYEACLDGGTPEWKAKAMYYAVMVGLPDKWLAPSTTKNKNNGMARQMQEINELDVSQVDTTLQKAQLEEVMRFIKADNPNLKTLDSVAVAAAQKLRHKQVLELDDK